MDETTNDDEGWGTCNVRIDASVRSLRYDAGTIFTKMTSRWGNGGN